MILYHGSDMAADKPGPCAHILAGSKPMHSVCAKFAHTEFAGPGKR